MPATIQRDFQQILAQPVLAYEEGVRFFRGKGLMNKTLRRLARDLEARGIAYNIIGAIALNQHGYQRFTVDIDVLLTPDGLRRFTEELVGRGYRPAFEGARKQFKATAENITVDVITSGEYPGDGKPKPIVFPDPATYPVEINGIQTLALPQLVELKLASGMTGRGRLKDLADVQELIRVLGLSAEFAEQLDPFVQPKYRELHSELTEDAGVDEPHQG